MTIVLRNRPECHYCGKRNKPINSQKFRCQHCLADNFLDENGDITDVPAEIAAAPQQFAYPVQSYSTDSIFCPACLKNQAFYTAALSEFLPDPDDPEYDRFEAALPEFKSRIEKQYPQCCVRCEPKVRAQLQQATYNARTDHLRRVLQKSRARRIANRLGWRSLFVFIAGLGNIVSLSIQLLWHIFGSQSASSRIVLVQPLQCLSQWPFPRQCADMVHDYLWVSMLLALVCIWWNPQWQSKLQGRAERLIGLSNYYRCQAMLLMFRFAAWVIIKDVPALRVHQDKLHSVFLIFISLIAFYGYSLVKVNQTPLVDWHQQPMPILTQGPYETSLISPPSSQETFSVNNLRTAEDNEIRIWRPPTPPVDEEDAMDWDPSPVTFTPQPKKLTYKSTQPTPFHGALPQVPRGSVFARTKPAEQSKVMGIPMGFFDKPVSNAAKPELEMRAPLAQPKFFPNNDRADTGLETIFGKVFSLHDDALEVRSEPMIDSKGHTIFEAPAKIPRQQQLLSMKRLFHAVAAFGLLTTIAYALTAWSSRLLSHDHVIDFLYIMAAIPVCNAISAIFTKASSSDTVFHVAVSAGMICLLIGRPHDQSLLLPLWNKLVIGTLCTLLVQEILSFGTDDSQIIQTQQEVVQQNPIPPIRQTGNTSVRRGSVSSVTTDSSIATTSTASGWKTPVPNHRSELANVTRSLPASNTFGIGSLGINDFTVGSSVAGPRARRTLRQ